MRLIADSLEAAVEILAKRALDLQARPRTWQEKQAAGMSDMLGGIGNWAKENPMATSGIVGGALGAGMGGIGTMLGNRDKDEDERRSVIGSALTGGLAGAAMGAGGAAAYKGFQGYNQPKGSDVTGLNEQVKKLQERNPLDQTVLSGISGLWNKAKEHWPTALTLGGIGGADVALHNQKLRLGERLGVGAVRPQVSNNIKDLRAGLAEVLKKPSEHGFTEAQGSLLQRLHERGGRALDLLARDHSRGFRGRISASAEQPGTIDLETKGPHGNILETRQQAVTQKVPTSQHVEITPELFGRIKEKGVAARFPFSDKTPGAIREPYMMRLPGMADRAISEGAMRNWRLARRGLAYGAPLLGTYLMSAYNENSAKDQALAELMAKHPELAPK